MKDRISALGEIRTEDYFTEGVLPCCWSSDQRSQISGCVWGANFIKITTRIHDGLALYVSLNNANI